MINMISTKGMISTINMTSMTNTIGMESRRVHMEIEIGIVETMIEKRIRVNRGEDTLENNRDTNGRKKEVKTKIKKEAEAERTRRTRRMRKKMRLLIIDELCYVLTLS